ncbi:MAG: ABC transporter ATP-binding protein [Bacteroidaceae bacterium]|nr:ABC transporter ATP-binding protein [Bacteroidaceae bacterium]MDE7165935.1 ABC transporter ATP-binding protein [Bacteroidaceae bacterium]
MNTENLQPVSSPAEQPAVRLQLSDVKKIFRTEEIETIALGGVSLEVKDGEFLAIMGPSGCGKSTLLNILGLLDNPTEGTYLLDGEEVGRLHERQRTHARKGKIGFVFQSFNLIDELNVEQNVELPLRYLGIPADERKQRVQEILKRMAISHRAKHYPHQLSGGQQQRVAIARAVVSNPKIILADEPTGNLDSRNGLEVMQLLTQLNQEGTTIIMVTHSQRDAQYAHRIVEMLDGMLV